jgi:TonB family protein
VIVRAIAARLAVVALVSGCASSPPPAQNAYANATVTSTPSPPVTSSAPVTRNGMRALPLSAVATSFATYLNAMHARIHPEFTDKELAKLAALPANDPLNDKTLRTKLELVVGGADGRLVSVTVAKSSGAPGFDAAAVDSVRRADGFGVPPRGIVSEDGNVYVDWEFSRDETFACSTMHSRPFLLAR